MHICILVSYGAWCRQNIMMNCYIHIYWRDRDVMWIWSLYKMEEDQEWVISEANKISSPVIYTLFQLENVALGRFKYSQGSDCEWDMESGMDASQLNWRDRGRIEICAVASCIISKRYVYVKLVINIYKIYTPPCVCIAYEYLSTDSPSHICSNSLPIHTPTSSGHHALHLRRRYRRFHRLRKRRPSTINAIDIASIIYRRKDIDTINHHKDVNTYIENRKPSSSSQ